MLARLVRLAAIQARTFRSLRNSEARFRSLTELSSDWYWETDAEGRFTLVKGKGYRSASGGLLGWRREELDGRDLEARPWPPTARTSPRAGHSATSRTRA